MSRQIWLAAVGSSEEPLSDRWIEEHPELLRAWPIGQKTRSGIKSGDLLVYYAAGHKKLIAVVRASQDGRGVDSALPVQTKLAVPIIKFAPDYTVLGKRPEAITGMKAQLLTDDEYDRGLDAFIAGLRRVR